jgi:hypothetical protein
MFQVLVKVRTLRFLRFSAVRGIEPGKRPIGDIYGVHTDRHFKAAMHMHCYC